MAFVLIIAGAVLLVAAVRNAQQVLFALLRRDFTGPNNFIYWVVSILIIGAVGYIPRAKPASDAFLILIILVLFLKKDTGFFARFQQALGSTQTASQDQLRQQAIDALGSVGPVQPTQSPGGASGRVGR
jgi:hypothetical protein